MTPIERYNSDVETKLVSYDQAQFDVVTELQGLFEDLLNVGDEGMSLLSRLKVWMGAPGDKKSSASGLYLWGGVGRGKTYLMDLFFDCLPTKRKLRTHFHRFMQQVHEDLGRAQGQKNPLQQVANNIALQADILCFDEFFVSDIGDAMILAGLLEALFEKGVVLVTTSNIHPDGLYQDGLQRERFLPAIELIRQHTRIIEIVAGLDYRLRSLSQATLYHTPMDDNAERSLLENFRELAPDLTDIAENTPISILGREVQSRFHADDVVWFEFEHLCEGPRSAFDYVEIARLYHAVLLSGVPVFDAARNDQARRFISLIDELYDRRVKLIIAADTPIEQLYQGGTLAFEFERTQSRLLEMQSHEYLGYEHRA